jgi:hypothetical protein
MLAEGALLLTNSLLVVHSSPACLGVRFTYAVQTISPTGTAGPRIVRAARLPLRPLLRSLLRVKQACLIALQMSAYDPERGRTSGLLSCFGIKTTKLLDFPYFAAAISFGPSFTVSLLILPVKRNGTW